VSNDFRNVTDEFKGMPIDDIISRLDERGSQVEIAIENTLRDFNMGSIVRSANAFGVRVVHVIGRRQWNKRGAMMTDKYLRVMYHSDFATFKHHAAQYDRRIVAIDNVEGSTPMATADKVSTDILLFGQEGPGLSQDALALADATVAIEQIGSTRSLNVSVAAGIALYEWTAVHRVDAP
jgi:tRNA G18 (ribose-2'-O)-methylase SpoU